MLTTFVMSILEEPHRLDAESAAEPPLRQIIDVLQQVMSTHDAEKLAIAVLAIYEDGHHEGRCQQRYCSHQEDRTEESYQYW